VKVGVGQKPPEYDLADYVLGHFAKEDLPVMREAAARAADAVETLIKEGCDSAMNKYNGS
jgi:PTH1 family peptidyl-tRNA hydrolase